VHGGGEGEFFGVEEGLGGGRGVAEQGDGEVGGAGGGGDLEAVGLEAELEVGAGEEVGGVAVGDGDDGGVDGVEGGGVDLAREWGEAGLLGCEEGGGEGKGEQGGTAGQVILARIAGGGEDHSETISSE